MKEVKITNAVVIPFYGKQEHVIIRPSSLSDNTLVCFNVKTRETGNLEKNKFLYEKCTIYAKDNETVEQAKKIIKLNAIINIEGYETSWESKTKKIKYRQVVVKTIFPISDSAVEE